MSTASTATGEGKNPVTNLNTQEKVNPLVINESIMMFPNNSSVCKDYQSNIKISTF
jgi:hypothetical protein